MRGNALLYCVEKIDRGSRQCSAISFDSIPHNVLELQGIKARERSEAYTSKLGDVISQIIGYDIHKCAAIMFALKVINYDLFK